MSGRERDRGGRRPGRTGASSEAGAHQAGAELAGTTFRSGMMPGREFLAHRGLVGLDLGLAGGIDSLE
jgi:hypothetical protein